MLRNSPLTFQRFMDRVVEGLQNTFVHVDDIVIFTNTYLEHLVALKKLLDRLKQYGLVVNKEKSQFFTQKVEYLGYEITPKGYRPNEIVLPKLDKIGTPYRNS